MNNLSPQKIKRSSRGFTMIEVMIAAVIVTVVMLGSSALQSSLMSKTSGNKDQAFATEKAMQMFEEMRAFVQANREDPLNNLNNFHDGSNNYNWILTTERKPLDPTKPTGTQVDIGNPGDPLSGNVLVSTDPQKWKYVRQIIIDPVPHDANARHVTVNIWHASTGSNNEVPKYVTTPLASISGILKSNIGQAPPTQVYDIYLLALENMPGWWSDLSTLRPLFDQMLNDLENRNPGLQYRRHYITRLGYGRDPYYLPYINSANDTASQDLPWTYTYPGKITPVNTSSATESYVASLITGRLRNDDSFFGFSNKTSSDYRPYAIADQNNHTVRYSEEKAMYNRLNAAKDSPDEPSLLTLLEELNTNPNRFRHAIIINLHGELLPLPPYRNYSDAAKIPDVSNMAKVRVVTHPEKLQSTNDSWVNLRVYPHRMVDETGTIGASPAPAPSATATPVPGDFINETTVFIPTDGAGTSPSTGAANGGFLDNPNFTPTLTNAQTAVRVARVIGSVYKQYAVLSSDVTADTDEYTGVIQTTNASSSTSVATLAFSSTAATNFAVGDRVKFTCSGVEQHRWVTARSSSATWTITLNANHSNTCASGTQVFKRKDHISANHTPINPINNAITTGGTQLQFSRMDVNDFQHGQMLAIYSGNTSRTVPSGNPTWVGRVTNREAHGASNGKVDVTPALPTLASGDMVFKHRDYLVSVNPTVFGQTKPGILITLYGSPTRHDAHAGSNTGLSYGAQLYQTQYIPAPVASVSPNPTPNSEAEFGKNLVNTSSTDAKNSARWIIGLNTNTFGAGFDNQKMAIETRLVPETLPSGWDFYTAPEKVLEQGIAGDGDTHRPEDTATGTAENSTVLRDNLYNVSRTYVYMGSKTLPITEKYQYQGDARYTPYADIKTAHGYNWYFYQNNCSSNNTAFASGTGLNASGSCSSGEIGYANYARKQAPSWNTNDSDLNRFYGLYSNGIMTANAVYTSISGYSNFYYGLGGEMGTDSANTEFAMRQQPWSSSDTGTTTQTSDSSTVSEITGAIRLVMRTTSDSWYARPWLGELFPDNEAQFWEENGNLPSLDYSSTHKLGTTNNANTYYRGNYTSARVSSKQTTNAIYLTARKKGVNEQGSGTFMNGNTSGSGTNRFNHIYNDSGIGALTQNTGEAGRNLVDAFNLALNPAPDAHRPFTINEAGTQPPGYSETEISSVRNKLALVDISSGAATTSVSEYNSYYRISGSTSQIASAVVKMTRNSDANLVAYVLVNGLAKQLNSGANTLARFAQAGALQAYMDGGDFTSPGDASGRIVPVPRVAITAPAPTLIQENPTNITLTFTTDWKRWDNQKYSPAYPSVWYDVAPVVFNGLYSSDNGQTWAYINHPTVTIPSSKLGKYNATYDLVGTKSVTALSSYSIDWNVSDSSFDGNYLVRIEAYRQSIPDNGYAYHQSPVTIKR